jgi:hypothetical protein
MSQPSLQKCFAPITEELAQVGRQFDLGELQSATIKPDKTFVVVYPQAVCTFKWDGSLLSNVSNVQPS